MNKTLWNKFLNGQLAVNCRTENQAKKFLKYCEEQGIRWASGSLPTKAGPYWDAYKENTTYVITVCELQFSNIEYDKCAGIEVFSLKLSFIKRLFMKVWKAK